MATLRSRGTETPTAQQRLGVSGTPALLSRSWAMGQVQAAGMA
jgi:hypothetical protein